MEISNNDIIKCAEAELNRAAAWLIANAEIFSSTNLKMYQAFYYIGNTDCKRDFPYLDKSGTDWIDLFYQWCEFEYYVALEDLKENYGIDFRELQNYIGSTSSFYLHNCQSLVTDSYGNINITDTLYNMILDEYSDYIDLTYSENDGIKISINPDYEESELDLCKDIYAGKTFTQLIEDRYNDTLTACNYLHDFKESQVDNLKSWLECQECDETDYTVNEAYEENARRDNLKKFDKVTADIYDRYGIDADDLLTLYQAATA